MKYMSGSEARLTCSASLPPAVQIDSSLSFKTGEKVAPRQFCPNHGVGRRGIRHAHVRDMVRAERGAFGNADDPFVSILSHTTRFNERRMIDP
jgi:hypothetical protein